MLFRLALAMLVAVAGPLAAIHAACARVTGHLYFTTIGNDAETIRYPLVDGLPGSKPDLVIQGDYGYVTAVGPDGTLYTNSALDQGLQFYAFPPNATKPNRSFTVPSACYGTYLSGTAVDPFGDFWVTEFSFGSRAVAGTRLGADAAPRC